LDLEARLLIGGRLRRGWLLSKEGYAEGEEVFAEKEAC
jgi:hypothetical protein